MSNENKYISMFLLYALGDTIGFKNGEWESNYNKDTDLNSITEMIFEFIDLGGINGIDLKDWLVSDDTLYHIAIAKAILKYNGKIDDEFILEVKNHLIETHNKIGYDRHKNTIRRYPDRITNRYIEKFTEEKDGRDYGYDSATGTNGAAKRNLCIGIAFNKENQLDDLINISINLSKMTNNSPNGYLAGLTTAYFVSLGIRNIDVSKWIIMLINLLESEKVKSYITKDEEYIEYISYINYWKKYLDTRFVDGKPIKIRSTSNMYFRTSYYYQNFVKDTKFHVIGSSGFAAIIIAYDALLDCDGKWEKLIFYAALHPGSSDTTAAIAGGLYGILYEMGDVPIHMLCCIEEKETLLELGKKYFEKYS